MLTPETIPSVAHHPGGDLHWINWTLMVSVLTLVLAFRSSTALAFAFGMAVTGTITITTLLYLYIARRQWGAPLWLVISGGGMLLTVDLLFLTANLTKLVHGAWLPLLIGVTAFTVLTTWQRGPRAGHPPAPARRGVAAAGRCRSRRGTVPRGRQPLSQMIS